MEDKTNKQNMKMLLVYIMSFFACIVIVMLMSVIFGFGLPSTVVNPYDRPASSLSFHDHRL